MKMIRISLLNILVCFGSLVSAQDFQRGLQAAKKSDYQTALQEWRPLAEQGHAEAQSSLGVMYYNGEGVIQDYQESMKWHRLAADQGHAGSQFSLGLMYYNGEGVLQDYQEAVKWYRLAAEQGHAKAQNNLGLRYYNGDGVVQDYLYAHMWMNIATSLGNRNARNNRDHVQGRMTAEQIAQAQQLARECIRKNFKNCD